MSNTKKSIIVGMVTFAVFGTAYGLVMAEEVKIEVKATQNKRINDLMASTSVDVATAALMINSTDQLKEITKRMDTMIELMKKQNALLSK